ncbi:FtsK/SpoIIIE domain-containing protein [Kribbella sp. NPDC059898]|uniref:FtsK/SpoIIIE domain-containing protein n=1 Tax=Kribbella sp. NPDC059898 TaxID=3346995 RepID=UPI003664D363
MELNLTTVDSRSGARADQLVRIPRGLSVAGLADGLGRPGTTLFLGRKRLDPSTTLAKSGVREGGVIGLGGPVDVPDLLQSAPSGHATAVVELHAVSGPRAGRVWRVGPGSHEIGADPQCAIRLEGDDVPRRGLWITVGASGEAYWHRTEDVGGAVSNRRIGPPEDDAATSAIRPQDDEPMPGPEPAQRVVDPGTVPVGQVRVWPPDEDLVVGPMLLRCCGDIEPIAAIRVADDGFGLDYNRPPRLAPHLDEEKLRLPPPPPPPQNRPFPWPVVLMPLVLGLVMVGLFNSYYFLVFTLVSPLMMGMNFFSSRKSNRLDHIKARKLYFARQAALDEEIAVAVARERVIRNLTAPDPVRIAQLATRPGSRLWERRRHDPDYLLLRVGTADQESLKELDDQGREENHRTIRWTIPDAPIAVPLRNHGVLGIAGEAASVRALARWLTIQAAVLHSPQSLRIVVLAESDDATDWDWVRWLPQLRPGKGPAAVLIANDETTTAARVGELVSQIQGRHRRAEASTEREPMLEYEVMVIADGSRRLRDVPGFVQVLTEGPAVGVYSVCLDRDERLLPQECSGVVLAEDDTLLVRRPGIPDQRNVRADLVTPEWCEQIARSLAPVRDVSPDHDAGLPKTVKLLDELDLEPPEPTDLLARWQRRPASTSFVLGSDFDGKFVVDLVADGPHGLIAGTTGSGKSELLQTMVASLAVANRPDELTFVLVDYKGGSAFKECAGLPHTLGMVTDLDAHLVERVLESLEAELRRRERILAAADAKDLPDYQSKRVANPELARLPRLLLVIDEFAAMVREIPDFVPGLIGIAQRGRSLGIHLILATQRPAGVVTGDIRANTNLRIALRVTDQSESQDVVDVNEAASISPGIPGRALIRRGPRLADLFQTAWVGAERSSGTEEPEGPVDPAAVQVTELPWSDLGRAVDREDDDVEASTPTAPAPTDLQALVQALRAAAAELPDFAVQPQPWKPALGQQILLDELPDTSETPMFAPYALEDIPALQQQRVAGLDFETFGHLYVIGAPRSGRTQTLRTMAGSAAKNLSIADVHIYGIDAAGGGLAPLERLPHCGAVVSRHDMERMTRLLRRLNQELSERQELAGKHNATGLNELRKALPKSERPAHVLVFIDGWDALAATLDDSDHNHLLQDVMRLLREGAGLGMHVIATSERSLLGGRLASHNDHKLLLRQADRTDYQGVGLRVKIPSIVLPGRGWHVLTGTETQVAVLAAGGGAEQVDAISAIAAAATKRDAKVPPARRPFQLAELPSSIEFSEAYEHVGDAERRPQWGLIGIGGDEVSAVGVDLAGVGSSYAVLGSPGSGRSNALSCLAVSLLAGGSSLVVITPRESPLRMLARHPHVLLMDQADPADDVLRRALDHLPAGPKVVVIDDADLIMTAAADKLLKDIVVSGRDQGLALIFGATTDGFQSGMSGWAGAARRARRGLLLEARSFSDGELIGVRLGANITRSTPRQGRAWTTGPASTPIPVQVPLTILKTQQ